MSRSKWKFINFSNYQWKFSLKKKKFYFNRNIIINKLFLKKIIRIHKGNKFIFFKINELHLGFKFGEFSLTKKPFYFPKINKKKNKR